MNVVLVSISLAAGAVLGWLLARHRAELEVRAATGESAALRAVVEADRAAAAHREELLMRSADVAGLLRPLRDSLTQVGQQLTEVEKGRVVSDAALREQVLAM